MRASINWSCSIGKLRHRVVGELAKLVQPGRLTLDLSSPAFQACLNQLTVIPISLAIARVSTQLDFRSDPADELIAATSIVAGMQEFRC